MFCCQDDKPPARCHWKTGLIHLEFVTQNRDGTKDGNELSTRLFLQPFSTCVFALKSRCKDLITERVCVVSTQHVPVHVPEAWPGERSANDRWFHSYVWVWERGGSGISGGEQKRLDPQLSQRSLGSDTCAIASWRRNDESQVCTPVAYCAGHSCGLHTSACVCVCAWVCEKVQIWRSVSNEVLAAALATCVLGWSVCMSARKSHHGCAASGTLVLHLSTPS